MASSLGSQQDQDQHYQYPVSASLRAGVDSDHCLAAKELELWSWAVCVCIPGLPLTSWVILGKLEFSPLYHGDHIYLRELLGVRDHIGNSSRVPGTDSMSEIIATVRPPGFPKNVGKSCLMKLHPAEALELNLTFDFGHLDSLLFEWGNWILGSFRLSWSHLFN